MFYENLIYKKLFQRILVTPINGKLRIFSSGQGLASAAYSPRREEAHAAPDPARDPSRDPAPDPARHPVKRDNMSHIVPICFTYRHISFLSFDYVFWQLRGVQQQKL